MTKLRWGYVLAMLALSMTSASAQLHLGDPAPAAAAADVEWNEDLDAALASAKKTNKPIVILFDAAWCQFCRDLEKEIATPAVQSALKDWTCVHLNFDRNRDAARRLGVVSLPAIRTMRPNGRALTAQDGYLRTERLVAFLANAARDANTPTPEALLAEGAPDAVQLAALIAVFGDPEPAVREAAIRRLIPFPAESAAAVNAAFASGNLATRLSALDVLEAWRAPLTNLDPWRPETFTKDRLDALKAWSAKPVVVATAPALDAAQTAAAKADLARLIAAQGDAEAAAIRERMVRLGKATMPLVYESLRSATTDAARERLTLLRYRLAASDALALQWPGGLERLAASQVKTRHGALEELAKRISPRDTALLMELFSDTDALVRETSLRLLEQVGGPNATDALVDLLSDPDPNVRAAVLKTLTENPNAAMVPKIAEYVSRETDPDLIVHAVRVFRAAKTQQGINTLYTLMKHSSWRIRAEAVEALTEAIGRSNSDKRQEEFQKNMLAALEDEDGFVVSRAMAALERAEALPSVEAIARATEKHPDLVPSAIKLLAGNVREEGGPSGKRALELLREFSRSKVAGVRAAAIESLASYVGEKGAEQIQAGIRDEDAHVRIAAIRGLLYNLDKLYPRQDPWSRPGRNQLPPEEFLKKFTAGENRPEWMHACRDDLRKLLPAKDPPERILAAIALAALGYRDEALPSVMESVRNHPALVSDAAAILPWLPSATRNSTFKTFLTLADGTEPLADLVRGFARAHDLDAAGPLWDVLDHPKADMQLASTVSGQLRDLYFDERGSEISEQSRKRVSEEVRKRIGTGSELQRLIAMVLLVQADNAAAGTALETALADEKLSPALRLDYQQIQLAILKPREAEPLAAKLLKSPSVEARRLALGYFVRGSDAVRYVRDSIYLSVSSYYGRERLSAPTMPEAPAGLAIEDIKPMLDDKDPALAAGAAYMMALLGDNSGMPTLLAYYKTEQRRHEEVQKMVYRAITALALDDQTPLLTEIYRDIRKNNSYELGDFYWTIRAMKGEKVTALRKLIRAEVGMDSLR